MAGHARLKFVMTECSKTQIRLAGLIFRLMLKRRISCWNIRELFLMLLAQEQFSLIAVLKFLNLYVRQLEFYAYRGFWLIKKKKK